MKNKRKNLNKNLIITVAILITGIISPSINCQATEDYNALWENHKNIPIESDSFEGWPAGPRLGAEGAILIEARTGTILYAKNPHKRYYPASTTKILSALIGIENAELDEDVRISREAVFSIERDSSNVGLDPGEVITFEQCLYAVLVGSANEATNALGEHVGGSIPGFVEMMNERAKELGCLDSHFVTTNGLHDPEHYTTPYDLAQIGRAFFSNELLCKMSSTPRYYIPQSPTQPDDDLYINTHNQLFYIGGKYNRDYLIGSKTGYTNSARQTLVTCGEKNGMKLICVVMKEESPHQFEETLKLMEWGFDRFKNINISDNEKAYNVDEQDFFQEENDIFGGSARLIDIEKNDYVTVPITAAFDDLDSEIVFTGDKTQVAVINYSYHGQNVGYARVKVAELQNSMGFDFEKGPSVELNSIEEHGKNKTVKSKVVYVNVFTLLSRIIIISMLLVIIFTVHSVIGDYSFTRKGSNRINRQQRKFYRRGSRRQKSPFEDFD